MPFGVAERRKTKSVGFVNAVFGVKAFLSFISFSKSHVGLYPGSENGRWTFFCSLLKNLAAIFVVVELVQLILGEELVGGEHGLDADLLEADDAARPIELVALGAVHSNN